MRQQTRIPITNGFRNLRIQKQEKHDLTKTPTEDKTVALGDGGSPGISKLNVQLYEDEFGIPVEWVLAITKCESDSCLDPATTGLESTVKCFDVCEMGDNANKPSKPREDPIRCIKGYTGGTSTQNPNSSPTWQSNQIGNLARWYYRNDGYFFDKWKNNGDSGPPTSCFCTAPEALSESSSGSISAKAETFPDQYYYKDDNGSLISFYMSFDGTDVNIFLSNGGINVTKVEELPKTIQFGDYNISITPPPSSSSSITYTVTNA
jgi:hypothetical protein